MSLIVVGTVAFDELETPFGKTGKILGGAATYAALSASYLGAESKIISVVGDDFPQKDLDMMASKNIALDGLVQLEGEKTFFWKGKYHNDMNSRDTLDTQLNALDKFDPQVPDNYQGAEYLLLGNLHPNIQKQVINSLDKRPKLIVLDTMNFWMNNTWDELMEVIQEVDVLTINDEEARQMSGEYSLVKAAKKIMAMGPKHLVIKKGEHGALLFSGDHVFFAPALPLEEVFDPTGAGDTFAGGFCGYLAETDDLSFENMKRAVIYGSAMASLCVEKFGTERLESLDSADVSARIQEFAKLIAVELV